MDKKKSFLVNKDIGKLFVLKIFLVEMLGKKCVQKLFLAKMATNFMCKTRTLKWGQEVRGEEQGQYISDVH